MVLLATSYQIVDNEIGWVIIFAQFSRVSVRELAYSRSRGQRGQRGQPQPPIFHLVRSITTQSQGIMEAYYTD